ncbi:MAG TPA: serine hydrolase domain-containing protein [Actinomycetota bacterium]|nr:serine hydrolase domain-containing protein [Actinomycetota bacterium]
MGRGDASLERVRTFVERHRPVLDTPGLALALTDRERTLGVVLDGLANVDAGTPVGSEHRFQIGSISKGFTVMALLQEREGGRLDLNAPVTEYLPWFEVRSAFGPITVHHLLSHTAGIVCGMDSTGEAAHEVWSLRETHTGWAPGERFLYSNVGYKALGLVLEAVAGRPWWKVVRERVTEPIGIGDVDVVITNAARHRLAVGYTSPFDDRPWQPRHGWAPSAWFESATADGTICATADELAAYARLLLNRGEGVLSEGSFALMTRPVAGDPDAPGEMFGYGLKWVPQDGGPRLLGHSGGMIGFTAYLLVEPEAGIGVTVLMNSAFGRRLDLARFALACLGAEAGGAPLPDVPEPPDRASVPDASTFAGRFVDELGSANVLAEGDRLFLDEGDGRRAALLPIAEGRFAVDDPERDRHVLEVVWMGGAPVAVHWGPRSLRPPGAHATAGEVPAEWRALAGRYRSWNPWAPGFEVFARGDGLRLELLGDAVDLEGSQPLVPDADGSFVVGERPSPSRIRFDTPIDGRPTRAIFDAASFYRTAGP